MKYLLVLSLLLISCEGPDYSKYVHVELCESLKTVKEIGTCNKDGKCSVIYTDNTFGTQYLPIRGQEVGTNCKGWFVPPDEVDRYVERYQQQNPNLKIRTL
jgi:hypothetical protein